MNKFHTFACRVPSKIDEWLNEFVASGLRVSIEGYVADRNGWIFITVRTWKPEAPLKSILTGKPMHTDVATAYEEPVLILDEDEAGL